MLTDKRLVLTGVVTPTRVAYAVAEHAERHGAELLLTAFPQDRPLAEEVAAGCRGRRRSSTVGTTRCPAP